MKNHTREGKTMLEELTKDQLIEKVKQLRAENGALIKEITGGNRCTVVL